MLREISVLTKLNLCNMYGLNVLKNTKDKKQLRRTILVGAAALLVVAVVSFYVGLLVYGYVTLGLERVIPSYLIMISSLIILFFGIFKAGPVIFEKKGYDILCSLPVSSKSIVVARFIRMYVENLIFSLVVMIPGTIVYGFLMKLEFGFYLASVFVTLLLPLAPMTLAVILGSFVTAISSRSKHKSIIGALLPIAIVAGSLLFTGKLSVTAGELTPEMLTDFAEIITEAISNIYPPAVWLGELILGCGVTSGMASTMTSTTTIALSYLFGTFIVFLVMINVIGANLQGICQRLYGTVAKHDFAMESQIQNKVMVALLKKEFKRYFASSIYFSNTIMGPILAVIMTASLLFIDLEAAFGALPIEIDYMSILPLAVGTTFCIMNTTSTSISMEGKEWWLIKSLPLTTKQILNGKLLMNLALFAPFYVVSEILMIIGLGLDGGGLSDAAGLGYMIGELLWMIISPAVLILFSCVWGITCNLKFPVFNWENETSVVKQSVSALTGGLCGALVGILCIILFVIVPREFSWMMKLLLCLALVIATATLYNWNNRARLESLM